jgi:hypothetical protein
MAVSDTGTSVWRKPNWLTFRSAAAGLGVTSFVAYILLYAFCYGFLDRVGTVPDEVGISQQGLVARAAAFGAPFLGLLILFAIFIGALVAIAGGAMLAMCATVALTCSDAIKWLRSRTLKLPEERAHLETVTGHLSRRGARNGVSELRDGLDGAKGWIARRQQAALRVSLIGGPSIALVSGWTDDGLHQGIGTRIFGGIFEAVVYGAILYGVSAIRWYLGAILAIVATFSYLVINAATLGGELADHYKKHLTYKPFVPIAYFGLQADYVSAHWLTKPPQLDVTRLKRVLLLGHNGSVFLISDGRTLYRVNDRDVILAFKTEAP